jgi:hypothetical protein
MNTEQKGRILRDLWQGNTKYALEETLRILSPANDLYPEAQAIALRFQNYLQQHGRSPVDPRRPDTELSAIRAALTDVINRVPEDIAAPAPRKRWSAQEISVWVGIIGAILGWTGYKLNNFFPPSPKPPITQAKEPTDSVIQQARAIPQPSVASDTSQIQTPLPGPSPASRPPKIRKPVKINTQPEPATQQTNITVSGGQTGDIITGNGNTVTK